MFCFCFVDQAGPRTTPVPGPHGRGQLHNGAATSNLLSCWLSRNLYADGNLNKECGSGALGYSPSSHQASVIFAKQRAEGHQSYPFGTNSFSLFEIRLKATKPDISSPSVNSVSSCSALAPGVGRDAAPCGSCLWPCSVTGWRGPSDLLTSYSTCARTSSLPRSGSPPAPAPQNQLVFFANESSANEKQAANEGL